jgi:hypothetical protein
MPGGRTLQRFRSAAIKVALCAKAAGKFAACWLLLSTGIRMRRLSERALFQAAASKATRGQS